MNMRISKAFIYFIFCVSFCSRTNAQIPTANLVGYWPFDNINMVNDISGNNNDGINHGATLTTDRFGNCNQAYKFNGINSYISVPNSPSINLSNTDFSISFWMKVYDADTNALPICKNTYGAWGGYLFWANSGNNGYCTTYNHSSFYVAAGTHQDACSDNPICQDSTWHMLTGVYYHVTNQAFFYVDGVQQSSIGQASGPVGISSNLAFGAHSIGTTLFFTGVLDAIRIYDRALSQIEITALYNEPDPGQSGGSSFVKDTSICSTDIPVILYPGAAASYSWSTGASTSTIAINTSGTYWVRLTPPGNTCYINDTIHVSITSSPLINVIRDTSLCNHTGYILDASSASAITYSWSTGADNSFIYPSSAGVYWVKMLIDGCTVTDSAVITFLPTPISGLSKDTIICGEPIWLLITDTSSVVTWWNNSHDHQIAVSVPGMYSYTIDKNNCIAYDTILVKDQAKVPFPNVPNVFTPNQDNANNIFGFNAEGIEILEFKIFNRWGTNVYTSSGNVIKWDGRQNNDLVDDGVYFWETVYVNLCSSERSTRNGFLTLLK